MNRPEYAHAKREQKSHIVAGDQTPGKHAQRNARLIELNMLRILMIQDDFQELKTSIWYLEINMLIEYRNLSLKAKITRDHDLKIHAQACWQKHPTILTMSRNIGETYIGLSEAHSVLGAHPKSRSHRLPLFHETS